MMKRVRLGNVLEYEQPTKYIVENTEYNDNYAIPVLTAGKSFILGYTDEKNGIFNKDLPVIIFDDFTTATQFVDFPFKVKSSAMKILNAKKDIADVRYLFYLIQTINFNSTEHKRYWISKFSNIEISLPTLPEQQRIVALLDKADNLRQKRRQSLALMDEFLKSTFLEMFGDPVKNEKGWDLKKFSDVGKLDRGKSKHRPRNAPELLGGQYPLVQTGDIANSNGYIKEYKSTYSEIGLKQSKLWTKGTLCITIAANIAKTGILTFDACFPDSIVGFIPNSFVNNEYIQMWISFLQKTLEETAPESAQKNINLDILRNLKIPTPPIAHQNHFAKIANKTESAKEKMKTQLVEMDNNFNGLMAETFRG